tara:strand:+ start:489 stop:770 length:282 start_codon:yes stop_codon:yes gene_type:complete
MKRIVAFFITIFIVLATIYLNIDSDNDKNKVLLSRDSTISNYLSKNFKSGISIQDIGDLVIIEQKPNDATVIIDKNQLDDIIAFLNNTNSSDR